MPNKMIPFPHEIKITRPDFCYYVVYYSNKDRQWKPFNFIFLSIIIYGSKTHGVV